MLAQHGLGIRPECARVLRVLTMLLQKAAARSLTAFAVGSLMCRCGSALACSLPAGILILSRALLVRQTLGNHPWPCAAKTGLSLQKSLFGAAKVLPRCMES